MKIASIALTIFSASVVSAYADGSKVIAEAGLAIPSIEVPAPETPKSNQWLTLRKIQVNPADPGMNDTLIGKLERGFDAYEAVRELYANGFKARAYNDNQGGYLIFVDVKSQDAADRAVGLARYYYITEVLVGQDVYNDIFSLRSRSSYAVKQGTVKGAVNGSPMEIKIDKVQWTITGGMNNSPVDIKIDHDGKTITGGANNSPVDLRFQWSPGNVLMEGGANHSPVSYLADWKAGELTGYMGHAPLKLSFDMDEGSAGSMIVKVTGYANGAPVNLVYNKHNGHIGGDMNRGQVDISLVNCDLYDFLQYFFLFAGK